MTRRRNSTTQGMEVTACDIVDDGASITMHVDGNESALKTTSSRHVSICKCPVEELWQKTVSIVYADDGKSSEGVQNTEPLVEVIREVVVIETVETVEEQRFRAPTAKKSSGFKEGDGEEGKFSLLYGTEGFVWRDNLDAGQCLLRSS